MVVTPTKVFILCLTAVLSCSVAESAPLYRSVLIRDVPHVRQRPDFCGEACAEMFLAKLGSQADQDFVFDQSGLDPINGRGCYSRELVTALRRVGFRTGNGWFAVSSADPDRGLNALFRQMHSDLLAGVPSIICMHYDDSPDSTEHFRLVLGYDGDSDEVIYHEPAVERGSYRRMSRSQLLKLWPLKYDANQWTVIRFRLEPGRIVRGQTSQQLTDADYAQHVLSLRRRLAELKSRQTRLKERRDQEIAEELEKQKKAEEEEEEYEPKKLRPRIVSDFQIVIEEPFVVVGDEPFDSVQGWAQGTIRWATSRLKQDYFPADPKQIITIWLFRDRLSYEQNLYDVFRDYPHTPFGYYSRKSRALVMNIDTGGGTLVHEIVHPFMEANFPKCPSWLNEGMGSLYEQCSDRNGKIWGLVNWRLRGLQEALKDEEYELPTFEELCKTTTAEFYYDDPGTHYAQSRYLCFYLQEQGLLRKFYHEFRRNSEEDASGYETLQRVLGDVDMKEFQEEWEKYILDLRM